MARRLDRVLLSAYLLLLPWMWWSLPLRMQPADIAFVAFAATLIASGQVRHLSFRTLDSLVLVYLVCVAASVVDAADARRAMLELVKTASVVSVYLFVGIAARDEPARDLIVSTTAWATVAVCAFGVAYAVTSRAASLADGPLGRTMHVPYVGDVQRLSLGFLTPEMFGEYLTVSLPIVIGFFFDSRRSFRRGVGVAAVGCVCAAEMLTFSHSWVGAALSPLVFCWKRWSGPAWRLTRAAWLAAACTLLIGANLASIVYVRDITVTRTTVPGPRSGVSEDVVDTRTWPHVQVSATYNYLYYFVLKDLAWRTFLAHPVNGIGLGNFPIVTDQAVRENRLGEVCRTCLPHSTFFGHLAETGAIGAAGLLALMTGAIVLGARSIRASCDAEATWILRASVAALCGLLVNAINADVMHFRFLWIAFALLRASSGATSVVASADAIQSVGRRTRLI